MSSLMQPEKYERVLRQLAVFMDMHNLPGTIQIDGEQTLGRGAPEVSVLVSDQKEMDLWKQASPDYQIAAHNSADEDIAPRHSAVEYLVLGGESAGARSRDSVRLAPISSGWILCVRRNACQDAFASADSFGPALGQRLH